MVFKTYDREKSYRLHRIGNSGADSYKLNICNSIGHLCKCWADVFQMPHHRQYVKRYVQLTFHPAIRNMYSEKEIEIGDDDKKRSEFIYNFIKSKNPVASFNEMSIPKVIVQYWHCLDGLPSDVLNCIESWKVLTGNGFEFKLFDDSQAKQFITDYFDEKYLNAYLKCHHPAMRCDYFRLCYLYIFGGFYIDCDELYSNQKIDLLYSNNNIKVQPLCYSLNQEKMIDIEDYLYKPYDENKIYYFNNNPIITPPKHELISIALKRASDRLLNGKNISDIQSTTGPGNLTASIVYYLLRKGNQINIITDWNDISLSPWPLSYRNDDRNWRLHNSKSKTWFS